MVADQRFQEHGSLVVGAGIRIPAEDAHARAVDRAVEQPDVANWADSKVLHQRQDVLEGEVLDHWPNRSSRSA